MPPDDPTDPRTVAEHANALDEVAHELGAVGANGTGGATGVRGVDITEAMRMRGFPNGKRVLAVTRAHPNWNEVEGQRSRFRYSATSQGPGGGDNNEDVDIKAGVRPDGFSPQVELLNHRAARDPAPRDMQLEDAGAGT
jgi:hypothetical protein